MPLLSVFTISEESGPLAASMPPVFDANRNRMETTMIKTTNYTTSDLRSEIGQLLKRKGLGFWQLQEFVSRKVEGATPKIRAALRNKCGSSLRAALSEYREVL